MKIRIELQNGETYVGMLTKTEVKSSLRSAKAMVSHVPRKPVKCADAIARLWQNGKFKTRLSFQDVEKALEVLEVTYPTNTLSMALSRAKFLTIRGTRGAYKYVQRYSAN